MINKKSKIFLAGHKGMVGSAVLDTLKSRNYSNIITIEKKKLDLRNQNDVKKWVKRNQPDIIINAAAKVGGIKHNANFPANFIYDNLMISINIINAAYKNKVKKLFNLGSACIYPKHCKQPIKENYLLTGELEKTNEAYAIAKIASLKTCEYYNKQLGTKYYSLQPTNLYGENDNFDLNSSHVIPGLINKFYHAKINNEKSVEIWGSGKATREFMHVDDLAEAIYFLSQKKMSNNVLNIGTGEEISIRNLAKRICKISNFKGKIKFNTKLPDGTPRRIVDSSRIKKMGWKPKIYLDEGLKRTYKYFVNKKV